MFLLFFFPLPFVLIYFVYIPSQRFYFNFCLWFETLYNGILIRINYARSVLLEPYSKPGLCFELSKRKNKDKRKLWLMHVSICRHVRGMIKKPKPRWWGQTSSNKCRNRWTLLDWMGLTSFLASCLPQSCNKFVFIFTSSPKIFIKAGVFACLQQNEWTESTVVWPFSFIIFFQDISLSVYKWRFTNFNFLIILVFFAPTLLFFLLLLILDALIFALVVCKALPKVSPSCEKTPEWCFHRYAAAFFQYSTEGPVTRL